MDIVKDFLRPGHRLRPGGSYKKTLITIHSTANPGSTARNERDWLDNPSNRAEASWHYVVDEREAIQAIPDEEEAWHCGSGTGNRESIGIEICESGDRLKTLKNAAVFTAMKLKELGLDIGDMVRHFDWTGKDCPRILIDKRYIKDGLDWEWFRKEVERNMAEKEKKEKRYNTIDEIPGWGRETIQALIDEGCFADPDNLDLSEDMVRVFVVLGRRR